MTRDRPPRKAAAHQDFVRPKVSGSFAEAVRAVVRDLPRGEVVSYGEVARRAGYPRAARAVGNVLASSIGVPWWRVVRASGELVAGSREEQARRLRREGIAVRAGRLASPLTANLRSRRHRVAKG
jgi:methylated-DNA-protein-cysteine methyltransferase related protein